jgi:hypothetical protein
MLVRLILILLIFTGCQSGFLPCVKVKPDKVRKTHVRKNIRYAERNTTASAKTIPETPVKPNYYRGTDTRPALENIDVEEWDCPKPGVKRTIPKALKDNIRKNKKAYESYYRNKADSIAALQPAVKSDK